MDYNSLFESKDKCKETLQLLFNIYLNDKKVQVLDIVSIEEPEYDFFESLRYSIPYNFKIKYLVGIEDDPDSVTEGDLIIPKMHEGSYLLYTNNKIRLRTPVKMLRSSKPVTFYGSGKSKYLSIYGALTIHGALTDKPTVKFNNINGIYYLKNIFDKFNIVYKEKLSTNIPPAKSDEQYPELLVNERVKDKLKYIFEDMELQPCNHEGDNRYVLTYQDLYKLWSYSQSEPYKLDSTTPFDLIYSDTSKSILSHFRNCRELKLKLISSYYRMKNRNPKLNLTPVQKYVDTYYNMQSETVNDLQSASTTNALEHLSQSSKVYIVNSNNEKERLNYIADFVGVIDPVATPEGANSSLRNSMARNVEIEGNDLYIKVLDPKTLKEKKIKFIDYYYSKVLVSTSYDYIDKKIVPNDHGMIQIQYKGDYEWIDKNARFDYIRMDKSAMLGYSSAMIPFLNRTDGTRIAMATASQNMQAIPTVGCLPPIVSTGVGKEIYDKSTLNIKAKKDGEVIGILDQYIKVKNKDGSKEIYIVPPSINTSSHTTNKFIIDVKVGDKVKIGQVLASVNSFKDKELSLTTPLVIAYTNYYGSDYEDSIIISESAAKKLGHEAETEIEIKIVKSNNYILDKESLSLRTEFTAEESSEFQFLNDYMLPEIGTKVTPRSVLHAYMYEVDPEENKSARLRRILNAEDIIYQKVVTKCPSNIKEGIVKEVSVYTNALGSKLGYLKKHYDEVKAKKNAEIKEFTGKAPPEESVIMLPIDVEGIIKIKIEYINQCKLGDKLCNQYGSKGLVGRILKDSEVPKRDDGTPIDIIMSPESVISRKNVSQIFEATLGEASMRAWKKAGELIEDGNFNELRNLLNILYVTDRYSKYTNDQLIKKYKEYRGYFQIIASAYEERYTGKAMFKIMDYLGMPRDGLSKITYPPSERHPNGKSTRTGVVTGVTGIRRLHFIAEFKAKSTATRTDSEETSTGIGLTKRTGQKIGGQEVYAIAAAGNYDLLKELSPREKRHEIDINNDFLPLGLRLMVD